MERKRGEEINDDNKVFFTYSLLQCLEFFVADGRDMQPQIKLWGFLGRFWENGELNLIQAINFQVLIHPTASPVSIKLFKSILNRKAAPKSVVEKNFIELYLNNKR